MTISNVVTDLSFNHSNITAEEYQYLTPVTTPKPRKVFRKKIQRRITTTARPTTSTTVKPSTPVRSRTTTELYEKISRAPVRTYRPIVNYDYYDDSDEKVANRYAEGTKVILHEKGTVIYNFHKDTIDVIESLVKISSRVSLTQTCRIGRRMSCNITHIYLFIYHHTTYIYLNHIYP